MTTEDVRPGIEEMWDFAQDDPGYSRLWQQFMAPKLDKLARYWLVELSYGETFVADASEVAELAGEDTIESCDYLGVGVRVRLSADGYLDSTPWEFVATGSELGEWLAQELEWLEQKLEMTGDEV